MIEMEKILVICAHPDDETLGLGGTLALHSKNQDRLTKDRYREKKLVLFWGLIKQDIYG